MTTNKLMIEHVAAYLNDNDSTAGFIWPYGSPAVKQKYMELAALAIEAMQSYKHSDADQAIAKNCDHWKDGLCGVCGVQSQFNEVDANFHCAYFTQRTKTSVDD